MYLFFLYLVVHFVNVASHDPAAKTAKLIDLVHKVNNFEVKFPIQPNGPDDGKNKDADEDGLDIVETMKLLQKNYDVRKKFDDIPRQPRLQYIRNPEVLEDYKNRSNFRQKFIEYDDLSDMGSTQRSYFNEFVQVRFFRTKDKNRTKTGTATGDIDNENAAAGTKDENKLRFVEKGQDYEDKKIASGGSVNSKIIISKRKGDWNDKIDNGDDKYESKNDDFGNKNPNMNKKEHNSYRKEDFNRKDNFNTEKELGNKKNYDFNQKYENWNKKNDGSYIKTDTKKNDWNKNFQRDGRWDNIGIYKKTNVEMGGHNSYRNLPVKDIKYDAGQAAITPAKIDFNVPKHGSRNNYARNVDYRDNPNAKGRVNLFKTDIPKRKGPLYAY